jgi:pimeloyl-ACP methyl ester carboxylesterase
MSKLRRRTVLGFCLGGFAGAPGLRSACGMTLTPAPPFEPDALSVGIGAFLTRGGRGREQARIEVHYYKPRRLTPRSRILLVVPGAGRDGDEYRDAWIEPAERANVLVAALNYPEAQYDFAAYHMGGVVRDLSFPKGAAASNAVRIRDEEIVFTPNPRPDTWLFRDFDRIFNFLRAAVGSRQTGYDMFGHSAGGQILHRLVLFHPDSLAERIVAANSGFYTLPDLDTPLLFGLSGSGVDARSLARSFAAKLTLLLGENDNSDDAGGTHLHTPLADRQGLGRLQRGQYFFRFARACALQIGADFAWRMQTVPGVAHDFRAMSAAAARLLYG